MRGINSIDNLLDISDSISSNQFTIEKLIVFNKTINIQVPLYQRLYVWDLEEVKLFIEDISEAFTQNKHSYYIGNMMFANKQSHNNIFIDLIDGQQRFTTLWLTSILLGKYSSDLKRFAFIEKEPRLSFVSRPKVNEFFKSLENKNIDNLNNQNPFFGGIDFSIEPLKNGLENIYNAIKDVVVKYKWNESKLAQFSTYIFSNILMVQTTVPAKNDLNQIFESLNSGGKQLENHQILKSRFLKVLKSSSISKNEIDVLVYKWDAASKMNLHLERCIYSITSNNWETTMKGQVWNADFKSNKADDYFDLKNYNNSTIDPVSLIDILEKTEDADYLINEGKAQQENTKSIIGFSQFLLHSLRVYHLVYNIDKVVPVDSQNLLTYFDTANGVFSNPKNVKQFIELVFDLRYLFDKYVIRWSSENLDTLLLDKIYFNKTNSGNKVSYSVRREFVNENKQISLLQSVMYIVQEFKTQYWLTSYLHYLYNRYYTEHVLEDYNEAITQSVLFLEKLDTYFYCQKTSAEQNMSSLSFQNLTEVFKGNNIGDYNYIESELKKLNGTNFYRYWFYKVEYLLWKNRLAYKSLLSDNEYLLWEDFKINFKKSIEHIYPQSKDGFESETDRMFYKDIKEPILKDYFGNLVLLTVSENAEYGNMSVDDKKTKYKLKLSDNHIDALKSSLIFNLVDQENADWQKGGWNYSKAQYHLEKQILPIFKQELCTTNTQKIN
ncbi:DUF262 domain-containing HNH endonuclease family protein [Chishuiella sp.]|uniref:DUF262 domain-containing protein n=1 Tax=Chishuiella sp. TaxID=1969467 RepID=UPI0028A80853|nr:DUF262 domain-containing HNH endonuclease family protein [Chishuiella sp.]